MSRYDGEITSAGEVKVELEELLAAFGTAPPASPDRNDAMAQFLSGADGWRDAKAALRGTFAGLRRKVAGLTPGQDK